MTHTCSTLLIRCMDFRLEKAIHHGFLEVSHLCGDVDIVSLAGGSKAFTDPSVPVHAVLQDHVALSKKLHGITKVVLMNHTDCGAYGGRAAFGSDAEERAAHEQDLAAAKTAPGSRVPDRTC